MRCVGATARPGDPVLTKALLALAALLAVAMLMVAAGIAGNRPPLTRPPGVVERLGLYLTRNVAETGPQAVLEELRPLWLRGDPPALLVPVAQTMQDLGWREVSSDTAARRVSAEVVSSLFGFTDDVTVYLRDAGAGLSEAQVRAASRVGRGDLGANARHVIDLRAALEARGLVADPPR